MILNAYCLRDKLLFMINVECGVMVYVTNDGEDNVKGSLPTWSI